MSAPRSELGIWPAAVNAALLGTDRAPLSVTEADGALGTACAALIAGEPDAAAALLRVSAAASAYRRCGWMPPRVAEPPPPACPSDDRPACSPAAAALLRRILQGEHEQLLGGWLTLASRHGVRAPADTLRALLDTARRAPPLRPLVIAAGGARGHWLASLNEDWSYAAAETSADALAATWETGTGISRSDALRQLRAVDADRARRMLEQSWAQEAPAERAELVAALEEGLSAADEPFLERALDDRRKEVRQQAATMLVRLPASALVARMTGRATTLASMGKSRILHRPQIDVTLPAEAEAALVRDGVTAKAPGGTAIGEKAWWLAQIVGAVPPSTWTSTWSLDPAAILRAVDGHEWREPLVAGWLTATERHRDEAWAMALWESGDVARVDPTWSAPSPERVFARAVAVERVDAELRKSIAAERDALRSSHHVLITMLEWNHLWSDALARAVAARLKEYAGTGKIGFAGEVALRSLVDRCASAVQVSAADAFLDGWPEGSELWPMWAPSVDALMSVLRFRIELHLAFTEESRS